MRGREIWSWDWRGGLHVGLLVERFSRYVMLLHLSHDAKPIGDLRPDPGRAAQAQQASRLADLAPRGRDDRLKLPPLRWLVFHVPPTAWRPPTDRITRGLQRAGLRGCRRNLRSVAGHRIDAHGDGQDQCVVLARRDLHSVGPSDAEPFL